jgi:hypothetical protein
MRTLARIRSCVVATSFVGATLPARADEPAKPPPALVQVPAEDGSMPLDDNSHPSIEPVVSHPPWTGREAIWGGVGLIVAGAASLIVATPTICFTRSANQTYTPCWATLGASLGSLGLGGIVLVVGERQRDSYKQWLRAHPMFSGFTVSPSTHATSLGWSLEF